MSDFTSLVSKWHKLMHFEDEIQQLAEQGINLIRENRIESITADYVNKLCSIRIEGSSSSQDFAKRVSEVLETEIPADHVSKICERFLTSFALVARNQIPRSIAVKKLLHARRFEIHWEQGNHVAKWPELDVSFPFESAVRLCADHFGCADKPLEDAITKQFLEDVVNNGVSIPRLKFETKVDSVSVFHWEDAFVVMDDDQGEENDESEKKGLSPILISFQDDSEFFERRLLENLKDTQFPGDIHFLTQFHVDQVERSATDEIYSGVQDLLYETESMYQLDRGKLLPAVSSPAYWALSASIPLKKPELTFRRARFVKTLNRIRQEHTATELV